jgi:iron(III) transport system permease protein
MLVAIAIIAPLATVMGSLFAGPGESLPHLADTVLLRYVTNTVALCIGVIALTSVLGTVPAWLVTRYEIPGRNLIDWALILPLAIPTYVAAYAYAGFLDYTGPLQTFARNVLGMTGGSSYALPIASLPGLIWVISFTLYPYVYVVMRTSFATRSPRLLEAARTLGQRRSLLLRVALPTARPALAAGLALVLMETLNAYGAPFYFGVDTLTTAIFRTWFSLYDVLTAMQIAVMLLVLVAVILGAERLGRGRARYADESSSGAAYSRERLPTASRVLATTAAAVPVLFGFVLPVGTLLYWAALAPESTSIPSLLSLTATTVGSAGAAAVLCVGTAVLFAYTRRLARNRVVQAASSVATMGYAVPGAIVAIGVIVVTTSLESWGGWLIEEVSDAEVRAFLTGTLAALLFAYLVRYLAVAYRPISAGVEQLARGPDEAARSLGVPALARLRRVELPLLYRTLGSALVVVFIDVAKELPLTLVLRPFDFRTLAVRAYELASDERIVESAMPSLFLVLIGIVTVVLMKRMLDTGERKQYPGVET